MYCSRTAVATPCAVRMATSSRCIWWTELATRNKDRRSSRQAAVPTKTTSAKDFPKRRENPPELDAAAEGSWARVISLAFCLAGPLAAIEYQHGRTAATHPVTA